MRRLEAATVDLVVKTKAVARVGGVAAVTMVVLTAVAAGRASEATAGDGHSFGT